MKSKPEQLESRGYVNQGDESLYVDLSIEEKNLLLRSETPRERTIGARLLRSERNDISIGYLINALLIEKKLYSKIEICDTLIFFGDCSVKPLINILGRIGKNQHKNVPDEDFKKFSYPLPRDISSRTLSYIGIEALPELLDFISNTQDEERLSEAIDAIGYICFYNNVSTYKELLGIFNKFDDNELIKWKVIRAMSGMPESIKFLEDLFRDESTGNKLRREAGRSIRMLKMRKL